MAESREALLRHEIHLIAAHPKIEQAIFPSKIWNSFAAKRETICTGFSGEMAEELRNARIAPFARHLAQWVEMLQSIKEVLRFRRIQVWAAAGSHLKCSQFQFGR